jgi:hypothetical protein
MKLGKWSLAVFSLVSVTYFLIQFIIPVFAEYFMADTTNTYVNTSLAPDKWTKNGTAEIFNFTITAGTGPHNITNVTIVIPNISAISTNFTITLGSAGVSTGTWQVNWENNITIEGATTPQNITFNTTTSHILPTGVNYFWFTAKPIISTAEDSHTQAWKIITLDNTSLVNVTTLYTFVDSKPPNIDYLVYPTNNSYIYGNSSEPFVISVNELNLKNATLHWRPSPGITDWPTGSNVSMTCTGDAPAYTCVANVDSGLGIERVIEFYYETYDDVGYNAFNGTGSSPLRATIDKTSPKWTIGSNATSVDSNTQYNLDRVYGFQINWTDTNRISNVTIEHNFTGSAVNYSATQKSSSTFYYNFTSIPAGYYAYRWFANDSVIYENGNWNVSDQWNYTVAKNTSVANSLILAFNSTGNANKTYTYNEAVNASANKTISEGNITLWRGTTEISNEQQAIKQEIILGMLLGTIHFTTMHHKTILLLK